MTQIIPVGGTESPLFQILQGITFGIQQKKQRDEAEKIRQQQMAQRGTAADPSQFAGLIKMLSPFLMPTQDTLLSPLMKYF
jgi:hypothetical protein